MVVDRVDRLVAEARERVLLLGHKHKASPNGSILGRLASSGEVSRRQYEAGARYAEIVREHDALLGPLPARMASEASTESRARYRAAMAAYDRCRAALRDAGREDRMAAAVVDAVTVNNWELPELTPALRIGLTHLANALDQGGAAP